MKDGSDDDGGDHDDAYAQSNKRAAKDVARWKNARCADGTRPLQGFHVYKELRKDNVFSADHLPRPKVPRDFKLRHKFSRFELDRHRAAQMLATSFSTKRGEQGAGPVGQAASSTEPGSAPPKLFQVGQRPEAMSAASLASRLPPELADDEDKNSLANRFQSSNGGVGSSGRTCPRSALV